MLENRRVDGEWTLEMYYVILAPNKGVAQLD